jgi:competence protein ComEC
MPFLNNRLDLVVLTHSDADHVGGLPALFDRYQIGQVIQPRESASEGVYGNWLKALEQKHIPVLIAEAGQVVHLGQEVTITVLRPPREYQARQNDDNDVSVVLQVRCGRFSALLTGDVGPEVQQRLLASGVDLSSTVLKVPHHGAAGSLAPQFLTAVHPQFAIVSVGQDNRYGHPAPETMQMLSGSTVHRTDMDGTVTLKIEGERCWLTTNSQ